MKKCILLHPFCLLPENEKIHFKPNDLLASSINPFKADFLRTEKAKTTTNKKRMNAASNKTYEQMERRCNPTSREKLLPQTHPGSLRTTEQAGADATEHEKGRARDFM
ncbi:hypothetical protein KFK09_006626 [Dendrobium nobile]|uniref:Uncharacterized protein n=1 Tax=Dendrobium nobile TaxID=94219 RepID=A0A8T3BUZ7_DENNO|nr:hypothetical protein KFK09_006626 [Dendrobium nobile]